MSEREVYFDHNATTPLHPEVKQVISESLELFGNASSAHFFGRMARARVDHARREVAGFIGAKPDEIIFMGSGSEAGNTVLNIFTCQCAKCNAMTSNGAGIITTKIEHPCVLETAKCLEGRGAKVFYLDVDQKGRVDIDQLKSLLDTQDIGLVSVMMANNEIGTIEDIKTIAGLVHEKGAYMHTDAVQAVGKIPVDVNDLGVDFLSLSGHKINAPKGIGALYVRKGTPYCPLIRGGHQERGRRAGTENTLGIIALGKAIEVLKREMDAEIKHLGMLRDRLWEGINGAIDDIHRNGDPDNSLPGTLNVSFPGAEGESILLYLDLEGIAVSTGSACSTGSLEPSHVLMATGLGAEMAHGSVRFSLGYGNSVEDVDYVIEKLPPIIAKIRAMSSAY